jgi:hypothetical protein
LYTHVKFLVTVTLAYPFAFLPLMSIGRTGRVILTTDDSFDAGWCNKVLFGGKILPLNILSHIRLSLETNTVELMQH